MKAINNAVGAPSPVGTYSQAVCAGDLAFLAGQIGISPESAELVSGGVETEVKQVLSNITAVLEHVGSSPEQIVMTTIFLADINDAKLVNEIYGEFVDSAAPPARQTVAVRELPLGARVEISVIAQVLA